MAAGLNAIEFMDSTVVDLPKTRVGDFAQFLDHVLNEYRTQMQRITPRAFIDRVITSEIQRVDDLSDAIRDVVGRALGGDRSGAYQCLDRALTALGPYFQALMPTGDMSCVVDPMYRIRLDVSLPCPRGELFHIPFQKRHMVGPMRYSVAGVPCLYLGGSTHVCWRELGEPDKARVVLSRFHAVPGTGLRILNFGRRIALYADWVNKEPEKFIGPANEAVVIAAQVVCWPLIAACSIRVPDRSKPERPEYLVPQLVLEWITKTKAYHGIRYFSTHYPEYPDDPKTYMNYVFPVRMDAAHGYCRELRGLFEITEPVSWSDAMALPESTTKRPRYKYREVLEGALEAEYGRAESGLLGLPTGSV
jgi:hypothetical protein